MAETKTELSNTRETNVFSVTLILISLDQLLSIYTRISCFKLHAYVQISILTVRKQSLRKQAEYPVFSGIPKSKEILVHAVPFHSFMHVSNAHLKMLLTIANINVKTAKTRLAFPMASHPYRNSHRFFFDYKKMSQ